MENQENKISQEQLEELQGYVGKLNNAASQMFSKNQSYDFFSFCFSAP